MKNFIITLLVIFLCISKLYSEVNNPCEPSIKLEKPEYGYGPPSICIENIDNPLYLKEKSMLESKNDFYSYFRLGCIAYELKKYKEAIDFFKGAESLIKDKKPAVPCGAHFYTYFALTYEKTGNLKKAKYYYEKRGDPYYIHLINARIHRENKNYRKAEREYLLAQSVGLYEMHNYDPYKEVSEMYYEIKNYKKAKMYIGKYIKCAEYEYKDGGLGYIPFDKSHIDKARKSLHKIEEELKK